MPISVTEHFKIDRKLFDATGAFDSILDVDTRLFIDPFLLPKTDAPELQKGRDILLKYWGEILTLLSLSNSESDKTWAEAVKRLTFPEIKGFNFGYGGEGSWGSGMGPKIRKNLLATAHEIIKKGITNPIVFELVGVFEEGVGCDRISDMACKILHPQFLDFTERVFRACNVSIETMKINGREYAIPKNSFRKNEPIILAPRDILRDLPVAERWADISYVCNTNATLRSSLSSLIGKDWQYQIKKAKKRDIKKLLLENVELLKKFVEEYEKAKSERYDFRTDPTGEATWLRTAEEFVARNPLDLSRVGTIEESQALRDVLQKICRKFQSLVEDNGLWVFMYKDNKKPKPESASQLLFYAVSSIYCEFNNLSLARESNAGRGPVDFKLSDGSPNIVVDTKLSCNTKLAHAYEVQIPVYQKAEASFHSIILILLVTEKSRKRVDRLLKQRAADQKEGKNTPEIIVIDALPKKSASKA